MTEQNTIRVLEGTLLSIEDSRKVPGVKVMRLDTQKGEEVVSIWGDTPQELGGIAPKIGAKFRMEVIDKPRKSGDGVWTNLYKTRGGSFNIEGLGQAQLPSFEGKGAAAGTADRDQAAEYIEYQQRVALQCVKDARQVIKEALGERADNQAIVTLASAMFEKRAKAAFYYKGASK